MIIMMIIPVVGELVHEAVEEDGRPLAVHAELAALREVIGLPAKNKRHSQMCSRLRDSRIRLDWIHAT